MILNGVVLQPDVSGGLHWAERDIFVVADLHLEKGSSYAAEGQLLPPYDSRETLAVLAGALERLRPEVVICLGDSFHDRGASGRLDGEARARLATLSAGRHWFWIAGNHDPAPPEDLGGSCVEALAVGPLEFRHEPAVRPVAGEVCGHLHPCATVRVRGRSMRRRCFVTDGHRMVMPAFGAYTGGLDIFEPALSGLFPGGFETWVVGRDKVRPVKPGHLSVPARLAHAPGAGKSAAPTGKDPR